MKKERKTRSKKVFKHQSVRSIQLGPEPTVASEVEVQARLWFELLGAGYNARMEVKQANKNGRGARFDIVIYREAGIPIIIEVKKETRKAPIEDSGQFKQYQKFNAEILFCVGDDQIPDTLKKVRELMAIVI